MKTQQLPNPIDFIKNANLYSKYTFSVPEDTEKVCSVICFIEVYDTYCVECKKHSTFSAKNENNNIAIRRETVLAPILVGAVHRPARLAAGLYTASAICTRNNSHKQHFAFHISYAVSASNPGNKNIVGTIQKVGQYPSLADLELPQIKQYKDVIDEIYVDELGRAMGLAAHGIGVGSFVYLRRIFEKLISDVHAEAMLATQWDDKAYSSARMDERIKMLSSNLPSLIIENPKIYSILSKGIHELSEDDCLKHFEVLRLAIEIILDKRIELLSQKQKEERIKNALQSTFSDIALSAETKK